MGIRKTHTQHRDYFPNRSSTQIIDYKIEPKTNNRPKYNRKWTKVDSFELKVYGKLSVPFSIITILILDIIENGVIDAFGLLGVVNIG
jgi:hypothetical protein